MSRINKAAILALSALLSHTAQATIVYDVFDTDVINCNGAPHGLWTNSDIGGGSCSNYFSIDGTFTVYNNDANPDNWYATLDSFATNPQNISAQINLTFTGFEDGSSHYKQEGGAPYDSATMDFFTNVSGTIEILGDIYDIDTFVGDYTFQYGLGANAKQPDTLGGSAWMQSPDMSSHHWDLNLNFLTRPGTGIEINEPGTLLIMSLGLLALLRRRFK